jgi:hypothetical protein
MGVRQISSGATAVAVAVAILTAPAGAAEYRYSGKTANVQPGERSGPTAKCPRGTRLLGGGVSNDVDTNELRLASLAPVDSRGRKGDRDRITDDGFKASADNIGADPVAVRTWAICVRGKAGRKLVYRKKSQTADGGGGAFVTGPRLPCPGGARVVSGGGSIAGGYATSVLRGSTPDEGPDGDMLPDDEWISYFTHSGTRKATTYAVCAKGSFAKGLRYPAVASNIGPGNSFLQANCPDGKLVVGGGAVSGDIVQSIALTSTAPEDGGDPGFVRDNAWIAYADPEAIHPFEVTAVCHA